MAVIRQMVCSSPGCSSRISATVPQAKRQGWELYTGGARCAACRGEATRKDLVIEAAPVLARKVYVACVECGAVFESTQEYDDGWRPAIHWLTTEENKRRLREERVPIPLCPGFRKGGELVVEDQRS